MAVSISNFNDFSKKFSELRHSSDLFAFFLFDDRPSQKQVEQFASKNFDWLDTLAASADLFFFFIFLREDGDHPGEFSNPSLEVAKLFDLLPNNLPGVVLFTLAKDGASVSKGVFLPLKAELFQKDIGHVEEVFSDLFGLLQKCTSTGAKGNKLLKAIEQEVNHLTSKEQLRPLVQYLRSGLVYIAKSPKQIAASLYEAFAKELVRRAFGAQ